MAGKTKTTAEGCSEGINQSTPRKTPATTTRRSTSRMTVRRTEAPMIIRHEPLPASVAAARQRAERVAEQIALRAFFHYQARGHAHGDDLGDWLAAERELRAGR